ncbi:ssDNA endonuclease and repair protein rad10 [Malassezia brasiliensis]|uniref:SsDNA endonuclease and repair protein rad10 n=1 Tax=Malassezia brasiliensis TaxID=1821822 RepID=A0AAF0DU92_9BASI|nr:ssDNA endonuclease and repair protein rad10 [Malassezia brasiliensis]
MAQAREDASPQRARPHPLIRGAHASSNSILVNSCQRGNPILQHIKGVAWEYADIVPDYQVGLSSGVLFLSLRYFRLHPEYIHMRILKLAHMYTLRVLLVLCDVTDHQQAIKELTKIALVNRMVLLVAWTQEEAARYLETYKAFEQRPPDLIRTRVGETYDSQLAAVLTSVRGVNKTDVMTLSTHIGSLADIARAPPEKLAMLPGMGEVKVDNLTKAFRQAFRTDRAYRKPSKTSAPRDAGRTRIPNDSAPGGTDGPAEVADAPTQTGPSDILQESEPGTLEGLPDNFESLPEEEQLRIAMELSVNGFM